MSAIEPEPERRRWRQIQKHVDELHKYKFIAPKKGELTEPFNRESYCLTVREGLAKAWEESGGDRNELYEMRLPDNSILITNGKPRRLVD